MTFYRPISFIVLVVMFSISSFYFLENNDTLARVLVFFAIFASLTTFLLLKSLYYLKYGATFNELFFVVGLPLLPPLFAAVGAITGVNDLYFSNLLIASLTIQRQQIDFQLNFATILSLPYIFFSIYLLLRTFIRYEFVRWQAHSKGGPPGTLVGLVLAIGMGILYLTISLIFNDLIIGFFGFIYTLNGVLGFLS